MDLGIDGKVALVTAASKGLGRASALALSEAGAKVVICARGEAALKDAEAAMPGDALAIVSDVTDPAAPAALVAAASFLRCSAQRFRCAAAIRARAAGLSTRLAAGFPPPIDVMPTDETPGIAPIRSAIACSILTALSLSFTCADGIEMRNV